MTRVLDGLLTRSPVQVRSRALAKTVVYRLFMVLVTFAVALFFTGDVGQSVNIGVATNVLKTGTYYIHERAWDRVTWGVEG